MLHFLLLKHFYCENCPVEYCILFVQKGNDTENLSVVSPLYN